MRRVLMIVLKSPHYTLRSFLLRLTFVRSMDLLFLYGVRDEKRARTLETKILKGKEKNGMK